MIDAYVPEPISIPACVARAADTYQIPLKGLLAVWLTEGGKPGIEVKNTNGTVDYGAFQINTIWANKLNKEYGVTTDMLKNDMCASAMAGAYILKYNIILEGGDFWQGVGRYHSNTPELKRSYIEKVYANSMRF